MSENASPRTDTYILGRRALLLRAPRAHPSVKHRFGWRWYAGKCGVRRAVVRRSPDLADAILLGVGAERLGRELAAKRYDRREVRFERCACCGGEVWWFETEIAS